MGANRPWFINDRHTFEPCAPAEVNVLVIEEVQGIKPIQSPERATRNQHECSACPGCPTRGGVILLGVFRWPLPGFHQSCIPLAKCGEELIDASGHRQGVWIHEKKTAFGRDTG